MTTTNTEAPPAAPKPPGPAQRLLTTVGAQQLSLVLAIAILATIIGSQQPNFFRTANLEVIGTSIAILGIVAFGETIVILLGGLDISVGSQAGLASVVSAMVFTSTKSALLGILSALGIGIAAGLVNGVVIIYGRVNAVIATLATYAGYRGVANLVSNGRSQGYTGLDSTFVFLARGKIAGVPVLIWTFLWAGAIIYVLLRYTDIGRNLYAIGGNATASRLAGIRLNRYIVVVYALMGLIAAISGVLLTARTGAGQPTSGSQGLELQAITAAALGGCALQGGKGSVIGTALAVVLLGTLTNGLQILNVNSFWQDISQGILLVAAVVLQQQRSRGTRRVGLPA